MSEDIRKMHEYLNDAETKQQGGAMELPMKGRVYHPKVNVDNELVDKVIFDAKVDDKSEHGLRLKMIETIDSKGKQLIGLYQNVGAVWVQENEKAPNLFFKGNITVNKKELDISMWKNQDKETGDEWVSVNIDNKYVNPDK